MTSRYLARCTVGLSHSSEILAQEKPVHYIPVYLSVVSREWNVPYSYADIATAIARANGQALKDIRVGGLNGSTAGDLGPSRNVGPKGNSPYVKSTGHVYAHVRSFADGATNPNIIASSAISKASKSMWRDRHTAIEAATEMMNSPQAQPGIQTFMAAGPAPTAPTWLKHIPMDGTYFGYEAGKNELRLVETGSINFYMVGFSLFIYSCYPDGFVAGPKGLRYDDGLDGLAGLFG
jgi:hypothetical protein